MSDIDIDLGFIDGDVVALCADAEGHYAFHAALRDHEYVTRMASSHGIVSNARFHKDIGVRQMVLKAMTYHFDLLAELEAGNIELAGSTSDLKH